MAGNFSLYMSMYLESTVMLELRSLSFERVGKEMVQKEISGGLLTAPIYFSILNTPLPNVLIFWTYYKACFSPSPRYMRNCGVEHDEPYCILGLYLVLGTLEE